MENAKTEIIRKILKSKYDRLMEIKRQNHVKGTLNEYRSEYVAGFIDELQNEIDMLQIVLASFHGIDVVKGEKK